MPPAQTSTESRQRERIATEIFPSADDACRLLGSQIATLIRTNNQAGRSTVLGLATGSTPVRLYRELIRLHREDGLSFARVVTFNLDEYYGLPPTHSESYRCFMQEQFFDHLDIMPANTHVPDGTVPRADVFSYCQRYEAAISAAGGLDLQILGIGRTGHIGFNEPGSTRESRTRLVTLDLLTRRDAARDFLGEANVPRHAITMGVGTIMEAKHVVLLAWGEAKAAVVAAAVEQPPTTSLPASLLQGHPDVRFLLDGAAASGLTRCKHPWLVGPVDWTPAASRRAVVWLARHLDKPILKLLDEDYGEHGMADLITEQGPAYELNIRMFNELQHTITGWPGGKAGTDDAHRPERAHPATKRALIISPEPSDDVLGMGATIKRLAKQGHEVTVACLTSGNLAVPDDEALMAADLAREFLNREQQPSGDRSSGFIEAVRRRLEGKSSFDTDSPETRMFKGFIRRSEARAALKLCGIPAARVRFLDLSFYERGRYRQFRPNDTDVDTIATLLEELRPHQIFATGAGTDPNSVGSVCFTMLNDALTRTAASPWHGDCRVWLYRAPEQNWPIAEIDMAVPLSPKELTAKLSAIFQHKSQRSQTPLSSDAMHDAWQQAELSNRATAREYDRLGLAEYEAIEAFQLRRPAG